MKFADTNCFLTLIIQGINMTPDEIRLPETTMTLVAEAAKKEGVSLNEFVEKAIQERLAAQRRHPRERFVTPKKAPEMTQEEWRQFVMRMAGSIPDPTFRRHDQGTFEQRDEL